MREIAFRLWNGKSMESVSDITFFVDNEYHVNGEYPVNDGYMENKFGGNRYFLMQYVGVRDKNGAPIFEKDIVRHTHTLNGEIVQEFKGLVYFNRGSFWVKELGTWVEEGVYDGDYGKETVWSIDLPYYEVIGNLYEHKHLLGE